MTAPSMADVFAVHRGPILLAFGLYLLICLTLGFIAWARTRNLGDYILGGRSLNPWVTALSAQATDMSGWLLMGLPGLAYAAGIGSGWMAFGLTVGTYLNWRFVAAPLREATQKLDDSLTLPDYFERRFPARLPALRLLTAAFILVFFTFYTASGFVAAGKLFEVLFALPYHEAVLAGSLTMLAYTFFGGFLAVSWSDVLQGSLMFFALVVVALVGVAHAGGVDGMISALAGHHSGLLNPFSAAAGAAGFVGVISLLAWGLGYPGQPHILARFMAIRSAQEMHAARRIAMIWVVVVLLAAIVVGLAGAANLPIPLNDGDREKVFMVLAIRDFPAFIAGVCLAAILAAIMSTASAQLLVAGSAAAQDFYLGLLRPAAGRRELLWAGRLAVLAIAALAITLALSSHQNVLGLVAWAWAGFGATFGPAIVASLYWRRTTRNGVLAAIFVGGATVIVWRVIDDRYLHWGLYEMVPGVLLGTAALLICSRKDP